jgi:alpha-beta hydrolase superfamily lysophospholipase
MSSNLCGSPIFIKAILAYLTQLRTQPIIMPKIERLILKHIICMDGLAGHPETTFESLLRLEGSDYHIVLAPTDGINSHFDRVRNIVATNSCIQRAHPQDPIFLLGQSAGASATHLAARQIAMEGNINVRGVVLLSPAVPSVWRFYTRPLAAVMLKYLLKLCSPKTIMLEEADYLKLISPLPDSIAKKLAANRQPIVTREARRLALCPPAFKTNCWKTFLGYGSADRWINPKAQEHFANRIRMKNFMGVTIKAAEGAGHLTLSSEKGSAMVEAICEWMDPD